MMSGDIQRREVKPGQINAVLDSLRRESTEQESGKARIRATLANLIIVSNAASSAEETSDLVSSLAKVYPARFFILTVKPDLKAGDQLQTVVVSRTLENSSGKSLHTEEVYISVSPDKISVVKNVLLAHFVPDIDTILVELDALNRGDAEAQMIGSILPLANHYLSSLPSLNQNWPKSQFFAVKSLAWSKLARWREVIAEQFDALVAQRAVPNIRQVRIEADSSESHPARKESLILISWCAFSLGLSKISEFSKEDNELRVTMSSETSDKEVLFVLTHADDSDCGLAGIRRFVCSSADSDEAEVSFSLDCSFNSNTRLLEVLVRAEESGDQENKDACHFSVRRVATREPSKVEEVLSAISASDQRDLLTIDSNLRQVLEK